MKKIIVSQRIDYLKSRDETRDSIDQNLIFFLQKLECLSIPIPNFKINIGIMTSNFLKSIKPDGIVLSGGNNISQYPSRDELEFNLIKYAIKYKIPLIGICRGMQIINNFFEGSLTKINNHVNVSHKVNDNNGKELEVNSYHNYAIKDLPTCLSSGFTCSDGTIESFDHIKLPIHGIMWHPERLNKTNDFNINYFKKKLNL